MREDMQKESLTSSVAIVDEECTLSRPGMAADDCKNKSVEADAIVAAQLGLEGKNSRHSKVDTRKQWWMRGQIEENELVYTQQRGQKVETLCYDNRFLALRWR
jgi:hypothetical protein